MKKLYLLSVAGLLFFLKVASQSTNDTHFIAPHIKYEKLYPFIDTAVNYIQYHNAETMANFFNKLKESTNKRVGIVHIGDSHLQADIAASYSRNQLQEIFGFGGRGSMFPYTIAKTHATFDYKVEGTGRWERTRNIDTVPGFNIGITGITARTYDSTASFQINFIQDRARIQDHFKKLKLFCYAGPVSFDCQYRLDTNQVWTDIKCNGIADSAAAIEVILPYSPSTLFMRVIKNDTTQKYFEIYGLSLESINKTGLLYTSVGINGAKLKSFLKENLYESQIREFMPDLVILDLIANDLAYDDFDSTLIASYLTESIKKIRAASPQASVMIVGMQDIYLKNRNIVNAGIYASFIKSFAEKHHVAFYDYYTVSGRRYSMNKWFANGLSAKDKCHLSPQGYKLKGELFANAILKSYLYYLKNDKAALILSN